MSDSRVRVSDTSSQVESSQVKSMEQRIQDQRNASHMCSPIYRTRIDEQQRKKIFCLIENIAIFVSVCFEFASNSFPFHLFPFQSHPYSTALIRDDRKAAIIHDLLSCLMFTTSICRGPLPSPYHATEDDGKTNAIECRRGIFAVLKAHERC